MAADTLIHEFELPFQLYDVLNIEQLCENEKFNEHNRETFDAVLDTAQKMATNLFLPHNHIADKTEPCEYSVWTGSAVWACRCKRPIKLLFE